MKKTKPKTKRDQAQNRKRLSSKPVTNKRDQAQTKETKPKTKKDQAQNWKRLSSKQKKNQARKSKLETKNSTAR